MSKEKILEMMEYLYKEGLFTRSKVSDIAFKRFNNSDDVNEVISFREYNVLYQINRIL